MNKTIIIGLPDDFYLGDLIKENLIINGFDIIDISYKYKDFKYKSFFERSNNFVRKIFFKDKSFKLKLKFERHRQRLLNTLNDMQYRADYALLIRPDIYPDHFIELIKTKAHKMIAYQWDGLRRFPLVHNIIPLFDQFFVFDIQDYSIYQHQFSNLRYTTNFYFDTPRLLVPKKNYKHEILYIGHFIRKRMPDIFKFIRIIAHHKISFNINIIVKAKYQIQKTDLPVTYSIKRYTYEENIEMVKNASAIIDFNNKIHTGLSFRPFEAICFEKKLITNNSDIKYYDFYNKENIFIIEEDDEQQLDDFLNTPYKKIDPSIKQKYSFTNWLHYILDLQPYTPINQPTGIPL